MPAYRQFQSYLIYRVIRAPDEPVTYYILIIRHWNFQSTILHYLQLVSRAHGLNDFWILILGGGATFKWWIQQNQRNYTGPSGHPSKMSVFMISSLLEKRSGITVIGVASAREISYILIRQWAYLVINIQKNHLNMKIFLNVNHPNHTAEILVYMIIGCIFYRQQI